MRFFVSLCLFALLAFVGCANDTNLNPGRLVVHTTYGSTVTCSTATTDGSICVEQDLEALDDVRVADDLTVVDDAAVGGDLSVTGAISVTSPAFLIEGIRFCGNGNAGATAAHMGPVPLDDTEADLVTGGAGCDALDHATIGNVDDAWPRSPNVAFKPVSMACNGICTGASAANDTITLTLYDDTVAVADMTCNFTFAGDATANQCTVTDSSPATVAAGSLLAVKIAGTDDACESAGDDFECVVFVTY